MEWDFSPDDFLEYELVDEVNRSTINVSAGKIVVLAPDDGTDTQVIVERTQAVVTLLFQCARIYRRGRYTTSGPSVMRIHENGKRDYVVLPDSVTVFWGKPGFDFIVHDQQGKMIFDSATDRKSKKMALTSVALKIQETNPIVKFALSAFNSSIEQPENELIHLYEIRDAAKRYFGNSELAKSGLPICNKLWSRFGHLTSNAPLKQGRHRGFRYEDLRDATEKELEEVRTIARAILQRLFEHIARK